MNIFICFLPSCPHYSWIHVYKRANSFPQRFKPCLAHDIFPVDIFYELLGVLPINMGPFNSDFNVCYTFPPDCLSYFLLSSSLMTTFPRFGLSTVFYESLSILFRGKTFLFAKKGSSETRKETEKGVLYQTLLSQRPCIFTSTVRS